MVVISTTEFTESALWRDPQAEGYGRPYGGGVRLMKAIGHAAKQARLDAQPLRKQVHIAVALNEEGVDQSTISRFEAGGAPRNLERTLLAYEQETGKSVAAILRDACDRYEAEPPTPEELAEDLEAALGPDVEENGTRRGDLGAEPPAMEN